MFTLRLRAQFDPNFWCPKRGRLQHFRTPINTQHCSLYTKVKIIYELQQQLYGELQRYWWGSYDVDDFGCTAACAMVPTTPIFTKKLWVEHRGMLYGNDRQLTLFPMMFKSLGVDMVFVWLGYKLLHRVVRHKYFDPLGLLHNLP